MKELSIEEKAKAYDEALERAREINNEQRAQPFNVMTRVFPELKESEDERISKEIIDIIDSYDVAHLRAAGLPSRIPKYIAWLEKQSKHANFLSKIQVGDKVTRNEDGELVNLSQLNRVAKPAEEYNITGIKSKNAQGKLGEMIKNLKPAEWSEEDEAIKKELISYLAKKKSRETDGYAIWLKSLRPQNRWKPRDEQIKTCKEVYADILSEKGFDLGTVNSELNRLEEQLKKL